MPRDPFERFLCAGVSPRMLTATEAGELLEIARRGAAADLRLAQVENTIRSTRDRQVEAVKDEVRGLSDVLYCAYESLLVDLGFEPEPGQVDSDGSGAA